MSDLAKTKDWYDEDYLSAGFASQRLYPNEELLRFMGRNYFGIPKDKRKEIKILEIGSGTCANLWMISHEGYAAYGIDLSTQAIELGKKMLDHWGARAELCVASMADLPYQNDTFDTVVDVFSSYCMNEEDFKICLNEVSRVLKKGGRFFTYTPGKRSDTFLNHKPAEMLDDSTLSGIYRNSSPFDGNHYPFRFVHPEEHRELFENSGFKVEYLETVQRSYHDQKEVFEHIVVEAINA